MSAITFDQVTKASTRDWLRDTWVFAGRNAQHIRRLPEKLLDVTIQPVMFVMLFAYVFGGAIGVPGGNYREYLIGGIVVTAYFAAGGLLSSAWVNVIQLTVKLSGFVLAIPFAVAAVGGWRAANCQRSTVNAHGHLTCRRPLVDQIADGR